MRGSEGFSGQVCDPVPELIMTRRDKAALFVFKGVANSNFGVATITVSGEVWKI